MISNWQPAQSLVGDVVSGADITAASCLLPLDDAKIPLCLQGGKAQKWQLAFTPLIFCNVQSLVLWVCQFSPCSLRDFSQERSFFLHFCLWYSQSLACYITLALSDCPQSIKAGILTIGQNIQPKQPSQAHTSDGGREHLSFFSLVIAVRDMCFCFSFPWLCCSMWSQSSPLSPIWEGLLLSVIFSSFTTSSSRRISTPKYFILLYVSFILS